MSPQPKRIVLTGFMGAGKTTLGARLALALSWTFVDLDNEIVRTEQKSIADIFETVGEAGFRQVETRELERALAQERLVLALGGGALETPANLRLLKEDPETFLLYLSAPLDVLLARCHEQQSLPAAARRPIFERTAELAERFERRRPLYESAHWTLDTSGRTLDELLAAFLAKWNQ